MKERLLRLLTELKKEGPGNKFTGAGIVVYESLDDLPIFLMSENSCVEPDADVYATILKSSSAANPSHDGFNMITSNFKITHRNVYIAPQIKTDVTFDKRNGYGARYVTAIMGSAVPGILFTAVVSNSYGIVIFENGKAVWESIS